MAKKKQKQEVPYFLEAREAILGAAQAALDGSEDDLTGVDVVVLHVPKQGGFLIEHIHASQRKVISAVFIRYDQVGFIAQQFSRFWRELLIAVEAVRAAQAQEEVVPEVIEAQEAGVLHQVEMDVEDGTED